MHKIEDLKNLGKIYKTCKLKKLKYHSLSDEERHLLRDKNILKRFRTLENYTLKLLIFTIVKHC